MGPRLRPDLRWIVPAEGGILLLGHQTKQWLELPAFARIVPLFDGDRSVEDLIEACADLDAAIVHFAVGQLGVLGLLAKGGLDDPRARWVEAQGIDGESANAGFVGARVQVLGVDGVDGRVYEHALTAAGLTVVRTSPTLVVLVVPDVLTASLDSWNQAQSADSPGALLVQTHGRPAIVGPYLKRGLGGCWECLAHRVRGNRAVEGLLHRTHGPTYQTPKSRLTQPDGSAALAALVGTVVSEIAQLGGAAFADRMTLVDLGSLQFETHHVARRPQCRECGDPAWMSRQQNAPVRLDSDGAVVATDGGWRTRTPKQTISEFERHVSPVCGVVERLVDVVPEGILEGRVALVDAGRSRSRPWTSLTELRAGFRHLSFGKGRTLEQARASALCEALERYSAVYQGDEARRSASLNDMGELALDPRVMMGFSSTQYADRDAWNQRARQRSHWVPAELDPSRAIDWSPMWSLTNQQQKYAATNLVYYDVPFERDHAFGFADSNGVAAGNTPAEAVLQGLLELIERDAAAMWWYPRCSRPTVDLRSFDDPWVRGVQRLYTSLGRDVWVLDLTHDLGVPVFAAVSSSAEGPVDAPSMGLGAHLDPRIALGRALSELHQMLPYTQSLAAGRLQPGTDVHDWLTTASLARDTQLAPDPRASARPVSEWTMPCAPGPAAAVEWLVARLQQVNVEVLVLDQTRPDVGLPVVRVVAPGLRHFWPRFAPGRLYDVPRSLAWVGGPIVESSLNPIPVFF